MRRGGADAHRDGAGGERRGVGSGSGGFRVARHRCPEGAARSERAGQAAAGGGAVSRRVRPVSGSRSAGRCRCCRLLPGLCGLTFGLASATTHCACSEGRRWPSSTVEISEMVVMSAFHEPSAELAWAANGRAARSSSSARFKSCAEVAGGVSARVERR